ncbi:MAG: ATP-dependent helicase [Burkholderiaceae bacterium]
MPTAVTQAPARTARADPLAALDDEQRAAALHGQGESAPGPLLVIAGAGTGKTTTLASRVARLVLDGADPNRLLLLTFSRRAAQAMTQRAARLLHAALGLRATQAAPVLPWAGTFHSIGARLLRDHATSIGLAADFTILDRGDAEDLLALERERLGLARSEQRFPLKGTCAAILSRHVNARQPLAEVLREHFPWCAAHEAALRQLFRAYVQAKQDQHLLDYDDLLLYWQQMMAEPALGTFVAARFDHVLVDEYQDTNRLQAAIVHALAPRGRGLTVVGDDAQAIYGFRAAEVRNILDFPAAFDPPARVLSLTHNHRSTQAILDAANAVIALAAERFDKPLWSRKAGAKPQLVHVDDEMAQARWVADAVLEHREGGLALKQQAVLFRASHHSAALELELARRDIPFVKFGGLKFLEAAHVKDVLSVLRWVQNPRGRLAGFRVAQLMAGMGPASARRLLDAMHGAADPHAAMRAFEPPRAAAAHWAEWLAAHDALRAGAWPDDVATAVRWYEPHLQRLHDDAAIRTADLAQLARLAGQYASRERFLAELTLDPPEASSDEAGEPHRDEDYLILSTLHSAKGQEWNAVTLLNMVDGCMPADLAAGSHAELEEERRLLYVGMTRAKHHLALMVPQRFHVTQQSRYGDRHLYAGLTRFITPEVRTRFDEVCATAQPQAQAQPAAAPVAVDLAARVREAF